MHEIDLHGLKPEQASRRLGQELHAARVRGLDRVRVITGRGWGNTRQEPILRKHIETWLGGPSGSALGFQRFELGKLLAHIRQLPTRYDIHMGTIFARLVLQFNEFTDGVDGKPQIAGMANKREPLHGIITIESLTARASFRLTHQIDGLIVANSCDLYACRFR